MSALKTQDQGIIRLSQQDYLAILIESFLIDRRSQGLAIGTISFYKKKLQYFLSYCESQAVTQISQINPGDVHACFRSLRILLLWVELEEIMPTDWRNPIRKVRAPKLPIEPIEPVALTS